MALFKHGKWHMLLHICLHTSSLYPSSNITRNPIQPHPTVCMVWIGFIFGCETEGSIGPLSLVYAQAERDVVIDVLQAFLDVFILL